MKKKNYTHQMKDKMKQESQIAACWLLKLNFQQIVVFANVPVDDGDANDDDEVKYRAKN